MGRVRDEEEELAASSSSLSEVLLFTTMCIVGLPVQVFIKDGSIFSGIFYTASFHKGYGIVLKKARMVKKGTLNANVVKGDLIDTLVVRPGDLVQVVAKGVMLPADYASSDATTYDGGAVLGTSDSSPGSEHGTVMAGELPNQERHVGMGSSQEENGCNHASGLIEELIEANHSIATLNGRDTQIEENQAKTVHNQLTNGCLTPDATSPSAEVTKSVASEVSTSDAMGLGVNVRSLVQSPTAVAPRNHVTNRTVKESKLNPDAKIFSPSVSNFRSNPTPGLTVTSIAHVPNSIPMGQVAGPQSEVGMRSVAPPRTSWPVKVVPYVTSSLATADNGLQYSQPMAGHVLTRSQPIRHSSVYQPTTAVSSYLHPSHQNGIFGRPGQLVYMHPVSHDVQAPATLSQASHPYFTSHPIYVAKHDGVLAGQTLQASMNPPLLTNAPQPFMMPSHIQFSSMRPVPVLGPAVPYSTAKFP
ncbi:uncharacterized protein LOC141646849 isoform X2 [Silene latifolia]|uniref:uncharacterized protein LOC141646849 isoform X2 n=1 Tax=Silene latifolia TaxID=37657 RepID=UPI003D77588C